MKVLPLVLKGVLKAFAPELKPLKEYVFKKNDLDIKCEEFEKRIRVLEKNKCSKCSDDKGKWYDK